MTEWFKEPVLKTGAGQPAEGSNPSPSAKLRTEAAASVLVSTRFYTLRLYASYFEILDYTVTARFLPRPYLHCRDRLCELPKR